MRRISVIIGGAGTSSDPIYNGVNADVVNIQNLLTSPTGGAWIKTKDNKNEVILGINPSKEKLLSLIDKINKANVYYCFIYFAGHGGYSQKQNENLLKINGTESIKQSDLYTTAKKQLIISDACQTIIPSEYLGFIAEQIKFPTKVPAQAARSLFYSQLNQASEGIVLVQGCSHNEESFGDDTGGYYTQSILKATKNWSETLNQFNVLAIDSAFSESVNYLASNFKTNQNPSLNDSNIRYPFAIKSTATSLLS